MKNYPKYFLLFLFIMSITVPKSSFSQNKLKEPNLPDGIQWMSFEDAVKKNESKPKKIFIDVYTHWCGWCKRMDATTFQDKKVIDYLNKNYYSVKFDAETKDTIRFKNHDFFYHDEYRSNELAYSLMQGKMSYPTSLYLDEVFTLLSPAAGYLTTDQITPVLTYFGENIYKKKKWDEYINELTNAGTSEK